MIVEVAHLKKYFSKTKAVDGISFSLADGDVAGFIGPNGSGKTTTMRLMAGLDMPTDGDIFIDEVSCVEYPERVISNIGFMPDNLPDIKDITVEDFIDFFARAFGLRGKERLEAVRRVEGLTRLDSMNQKTLKSLSKGMKQRVSLARAIIHDPKLLILDEPAAGLDARARLEVLELIEQFSAMGKIILVSSHILSELGKVCNRYIIIEKGRLVSEDESSTAALKRLWIRLAGRAENSDELLRGFDGVVEVKRRASACELVFDGTDDDVAGLITAMVNMKLPVIEVKHLDKDLSDTYMRLTKGEVS